MVGLRAAKAAGMLCVITYTDQTAAGDFYGAGADAKMLDFGTARRRRRGRRRALLGRGRRAARAPRLRTGPEVRLLCA